MLGSSFVVGCLWLAPAAFSAVSADRWLSGAELDRDCLALEDGSVPPDATVCIAYLQGFIAGTTLLLDPVDRPTAKDESFSERAMRTRAAPYLRRVDDGARGAYCLADDVTPRSVLKAISEHLEARSAASGITAHEIVHEALVQRYPCEER